MTSAPVRHRRRSDRFAATARPPSTTGPPPFTARPLGPKRTRGARTLTLRVNRLSTSAATAATGGLVLLFGFGVYRAAAGNAKSGIGIIVVAAVLAAALAPRVRAGRLLFLRVTPLGVRLTNAWRPTLGIDRRADLRAVLWLTRPYEGATPVLRGLYLLDDTGVRSFSRLRSMDPDRLRRFLAAAVIPAELIDAATPPLGDGRAGAPPRGD